VFRGWCAKGAAAMKLCGRGDGDNAGEGGGAKADNPINSASPVRSSEASPHQGH
jgi:hypothetical protein